MRQRLALITALSLGLAIVSLGQPGKQAAPLGSVAARALDYFERIEGQSFDDYLKSVRPPQLSALHKAQAIARLPREGEIIPSTKGRAKLAALESVLNYHERSSTIEFKVVGVGYACVAFYARSVVLISEQALDLLTPEELQAVVAHELAHEYFWEEYELARQHKQYEKVQELELRCDGIAIITMHRLGLDATRVISAMIKLTRFNDRIGATATSDFYASLDERKKFNRAMIDRVKARAGADRFLAKKRQTL